jgi:DNA-binding transcriptional LysR family regulator
VRPIGSSIDAQLYKSVVQWTRQCRASREPMDLIQLRCFVAVAEELHFGRAAQRLGMLPAALGRHIRLLEDSLGARLFARTTRSVTLTDDGAAMLADARDLIGRAEALANRFRGNPRTRAPTVRLGAIDTAAAGLVPMLLHDFHGAHPNITVHLLEDKSLRLLPRLLSGSLDVAIIRPPATANRQLSILPLFHETPVVVVPSKHALARRKTVAIAALADEPLIIPDRRSRPHSHDLTMKLFERANIRPATAQIADEKQTIVNMVAAGLGVAIVPRWASKMAVSGVRFLQIAATDYTPGSMLPLAVAWMHGTRDLGRDALIATLTANLQRYAEDA